MPPSPHLLPPPPHTPASALGGGGMRDRGTWHWHRGTLLRAAREEILEWERLHERAVEIALGTSLARAIAWRDRRGA